VREKHYYVAGGWRLRGWSCKNGREEHCRAGGSSLQPNTVIG